jgi:hypothetical protein
VGFWDEAKDLIDPTGARNRPKVAPQPDPLAFLNQIAGPSSEDLYADAMAQVSNAYNAQIGNLNSQEADARKRAKTGDAQLAAMYAALQKDIRGNRGALGGIYDTASKRSQVDTAATKGAINKQYQQTNSELGSLFAQLGIEAAAPDALAGGNQDRNLLAGLVDASGANARNAFGLDKAAALGFNTAQENIAGLTGRDKRSDLMTQLNNAISGIGQQRNQVYGQMADAVSQRQYQLENDALQRQTQMQDMMFQMQKMQMESGAQEGMSQSQQYAQMGPTERAANKASTLFGNSAPWAMQLLTGVANNQNSGVYQNPGHFIRSILAENEKQKQAGNQYLDPDELQALASYFWSEGGTGTKVPQQNYYNLT